MTRRRDAPNPVEKALELTNSRGVVTVVEIAPRLRLSIFRTYQVMRALTRNGFVTQLDVLTFKAIDSTNGDQ